MSMVYCPQYSESWDSDFKTERDELPFNCTDPCNDCGMFSDENSSNED